MKVPKSSKDERVLTRKKRVIALVKRLIKAGKLKEEHEWQSTGRDARAAAGEEQETATITKLIDRIIDTGTPKEWLFERDLTKIATQRGAFGQQVAQKRKLVDIKTREHVTPSGPVHKRQKSAAQVAQEKHRARVQRVAAAGWREVDKHVLDAVLDKMADKLLGTPEVQQELTRYDQHRTIKKMLKRQNAFNLW